MPCIQGVCVWNGDLFLHFTPLKVDPETQWREKFFQWHSLRLLTLIICCVERTPPGIRTHAYVELKRAWPPVKSSIERLGKVVLEDKGEQNADGSLNT